MIDTAIEIAKAIGGFVALLLAIAAGCTLYITYRLRPTRMRSIELHSEQLKQTISQWLEDMEYPIRPESFASYLSSPGYIKISELSPYALYLETDILFQDLPNHLGPSLWEKWTAFLKIRRRKRLDNHLGPSVWKKWTEYKKGVDRYHRATRELTERVMLFATAETNLKVYHIGGGLHEENVLPHCVLDWLFKDLNAICNGEEPCWFDLKLASSPELEFEDGMLRKAGMPLVCSVLAEPGQTYASDQSVPEQVARNVYARLSRALKEGQDLPNLILNFRDHQRQFNDLCSLQESLRKDLQVWLKVPILPNDCYLLKKGPR